MNKKPGRPTGGSDARAALIKEAQRCFLASPYHKVSTRKIAESAGVDVALIRYYFGNKAGLFEATVHESAAPMIARIQKAINDGKIETLNDAVATFYKVMAPGPNLPALIIRSMMLDENDEQRKTVEKLFNHLLLPMQQMLFRRLQEKGALQENIDPEFARLSFFSLMVFPFIIPQSLATLQGITMDEDYLQRLAQHNAALLQHGIFKVQGDHTP
ncbi:Nucleoid occlusion factor SlmA [Grimontia celer]|uniref:Nucleoid occlusion factor SlmA n=1 Tax=Grimontia celer TaxID=1796497 RepID=A0A128FBZ7_9GAMM|nr:TetR/AcrR family transcriptional regulator [Grimontia celer]CZF84025.1 Nucleoid occlusion factor SlmA [Grimontia celer]